MTSPSLLAGRTVAISPLSTIYFKNLPQKESEYDQEIPQSHTADQPNAW